MARFLPLSLELATRLVVRIDPTPTEGRVPSITAGAIHVPLAVFSRIATVVDDRDLDEDAVREARRAAHEDEVAASGGAARETFHVPLGPLLEDLRMSPPTFARELGRIDAVAMSVAGRRRGPRLSCIRTEADLNRHGTWRVGVEQGLSFAAHVYGDAGTDSRDVVWWDSEAVSRMRSRYSPVAYLRALAWAARPDILPAARRASGHGQSLRMDIPIGEAREALGVDGYPVDAHFEARVVQAVGEDLAAAGILFDGWLARDRRGIATHLSLEISEATPALRERRPRKSKGRRTPAQRAKTRKPRVSRRSAPGRAP